MEVIFNAEKDKERLDALSVAKALVDSNLFSTDSLAELAEYLETFVRHERFGRFMCGERREE